jgi:hypothetical protein
MSAGTGEETQQAVIGYRDALTYVQQTPLMEFFDYSETLLATLRRHQRHTPPNRHQISVLNIYGP